MIHEGIESLERARDIGAEKKKGRKKQQFLAQMTRTIRLARKIEFLKQNEIDSKSKKECQEDLRSKMSALNKLQIVFKLPKAQRLDTKGLLKDMNDMIQIDSTQPIKQLYQPDHLLCLITGDMMTDPVTIESGRTYERANIETYFKIQKER